MPFFPFTAMTPTEPRSVRPGIDVDEYGYALPKNALPLPPPVAPTQSTNNLDSNLIAQLEAAKYGQTLHSQSTPTLEAPAQVPTQPQLNMQAQQSGGLLTNVPPSPSQAPKLTTEDELALAYGQQQELQNQAIKQAEEQLAAARSRPQQMDLSPLIALADAWSQRPMNLLSAYKRPEDQAKTVQALQEAVLKARGGAAELARMRYKDVNQLNLQERQMLINEDLKRAQIAAMGQKKSEKGDLQEKKFQFDVEEKYNKSLGAPIKQLGIFVSKVKDLRDYLSTKSYIPYNDQKYKSLVSQIVTQYNQDVAGLGALAGADLKLLMAAVGQESTGVTGAVDTYFRNKFGGGVGSAIESLARLETQADERVANETESLKSASTYPYIEKLHSKNLSIYNKSRGLEPEQQQSQNGSVYSKEDLDAEIKRRGLGGK